MYREALRAARLKAGLTQAELARRMGITQAHYSAVETGRRGTFGPRLSLALAEALQIDLEGLVRQAVTERAVVGFSTEAAGEAGREVLGMLWARYRSMTDADWERVRLAILSDGFPEPEEADLPERVVEYDE